MCFVHLEVLVESPLVVWGACTATKKKIIYEKTSSTSARNVEEILSSRWLCSSYRLVQEDLETKTYMIIQYMLERLNSVHILKSNNLCYLSMFE